MMHLWALYFELLERSLLGLLTEDPPLDPVYGVLRDPSGKQVQLGAVAGAVTIEAGTFDPRLRDEGLDWPMTALTMVGGKRLRQFRNAIETVIAENIPGDILEAGVWRGGACILARGVLAAHAHGALDRKVYVADSFEGMPAPDPRFPQDSGDWHHYANSVFSVSLEQVRANFTRYGLLDDRVVFLKGWFKDTLASAPISKLAVLRLDADMYESTLSVLEALYSKVSSGGIVIIDDYNAVPGCQRAVDHFRTLHGIVDPIELIDRVGVFWRKGAPPVLAETPGETPNKCPNCTYCAVCGKSHPFEGE